RRGRAASARRPPAAAERPARDRAPQARAGGRGPRPPGPAAPRRPHAGGGRVSATRAPLTGHEPQTAEERERERRLEDSGELVRRYAALAVHPYERRTLDAALRALDVVLAGALLALTAPATGAC